MLSVLKPHRWKLALLLIAANLGLILHLACGERGLARESLDRARTLVEEMGYHRRDGEVAELKEALGEA